MINLDSLHLSDDNSMFAPIVEFEDEVEELDESLDKRDINSQYKHGEIEPLDVMEEQGWLEGFCYGNIIKYAMRRKGSDKEDLQKIIDYAKILMAEEN